MSLKTIEVLTGQVPQGTVLPNGTTVYSLYQPSTESAFDYSVEIDLGTVGGSTTVAAYMRHSYVVTLADGTETALTRRPIHTLVNISGTAQAVQDSTTPALLPIGVVKQNAVGFSGMVTNDRVYFTVRVEEGVVPELVFVKTGTGNVTIDYVRVTRAYSI
jgi:hypothetical protein